MKYVVFYNSDLSANYEKTETDIDWASIEEKNEDYSMSDFKEEAQKYKNTTFGSTRVAIELAEAYEKNLINDTDYEIDGEYLYLLKRDFVYILATKNHDFIDVGKSSYTDRFKEYKHGGATLTFASGLSAFNWMKDNAVNIYS